MIKKKSKPKPKPKQSKIEIEKDLKALDYYLKFFNVDDINCDGCEGEAGCCE